MSNDKKQSKNKEAEPQQLGDKDPIAYEIKRAREGQGISLSDLSRQTGISRTVLFGYEAGRTRPGTREIRLISSALKTTPNRLLFGNDEPFQSRKGFSSIAQIAKSSPAAAGALAMLLIPTIVAILGEEENSALLTLIGSMVEARDKNAYFHIIAMVETMLEKANEPGGIAGWSKIQNDPDGLKAIQEQVKRRVEQMENE